MTELRAFEQRLQEKMRAAERQRSQEQQRLAGQAAEFEERQQRFVELATPVVQTIIRPRMESVAFNFPNASLRESPLANHCVISLTHVPRFPASVTLDIGVAHDDEISNLILTYSLQILPILMHFEPLYQEAFPLAEESSERVAALVEEWLIEFLDTYLRLEYSEHYQKKR